MSFSMSFFSPDTPPRFFTDAEAALAFVAEIYHTNTRSLQARFAAFSRGEGVAERQVAYYPYAAITTRQATTIDSRLAFGFVQGVGRFQISLTRPDVFAAYYKEQFRLLLANHGVPLEIGVSHAVIPVHFAYPEGMYLEQGLAPERLGQIRNFFAMPSLAAMDDRIVNGVAEPFGDGSRPLALFTAPRVDYSLHRLRHYTGTNPEDFQKFVIFTNYPFYVEEFVRTAQALLAQPEAEAEADAAQPYTALVEPGGRTLLKAVGDAPPQQRGEAMARLPQMPAYHLQRADGLGISLVNIGVGPSNAKNISDHIAVLRPHAWIMLGHCAGLHESQKLGDFVLAHAYVRDDHVLDYDLPQWVPVPALAEVQKALETAVATITAHHSAYAVKSVMRTGTVVTVDNRNWEITGYAQLVQRFSQSRAIALDMESATIAANGFRFRVPYGTLLCVSDKPLHGEIKLPGMANHFYKEQVGQHLKVGMQAMALLRENGLETLHSRKLRSFAESAFQ